MTYYMTLHDAPCAYMLWFDFGRHCLEDFRALEAFGDLSRGGDEIIGYRIEARDGYVGRRGFLRRGGELGGYRPSRNERRRLAGQIFVPLNAIKRIDQRLRRIYS